jgi:hypothetical protein
MANEIDLANLKKVVNSILDHVTNDLGIEMLPIKDDRDFYWEVPSDQLWTVRQQQPQLDIGRLSDDWEFVEGLKDVPRNEAIALMLIHVAPLLRYVGEKVGQ